VVSTNLQPVRAVSPIEIDMRGEVDDDMKLEERSTEGQTLS